MDHFNADSAARISESSEPSSGRDYRRVSVVHLQPGQSQRTARHQRDREGGKAAAIKKKLFHLTANLLHTIFSDLILHRISWAIWGVL